VFIYYFVHVEQPFAVAEWRLLNILSGLDGAATAAYREGELLRARIGVGGTDPVVAKAVRMSVGTPIRGRMETEIPVTWKATGTPGLFPAMDAGIVAADLGPNLTQIALRGTYDAPFGAVGRALDRTVLHRVAEASVKGFVDRIAHLIEHEGELKAAGSG